MLLAKIKNNQKFFRYILFSGHEYVKGEFRPVPQEYEYQARVDDRIDLKEVSKEEHEKPVDTPSPKKQRAAHKRKDESGEFADSEVES